jgi:carbamoyl-phosphate synthase large subunit
MIAGVGGASLGTEIFKCLRLAGRYEIYGCDVSATAFGLYETGFAHTYHINRENYVANVIDACKKSGVTWLIPGGEQPNALLGAAVDLLAKNGVRLVGNDFAVVRLFSDKEATFAKLADCGIVTPRTVALYSDDDVKHVGLPCIVKPATGSGGSTSVFFVTSTEEAIIYADFIRRTGSVPIAQEYVGDEEGEFTIGVLSLPNGQVVGSIALRRALDAKLSVAYRGRGGLISSGYSQGYIDTFPDLCRQAEQIATAIGSRGPINIQGRVRNGILMPFEINPRFSASTYLRALAGFNEIDMLMRYLSSGLVPALQPVKAGWYLRSLTEVFVAEGTLK